MLYERASLVKLSIRIKISFPRSTCLFAICSTFSVTSVCTLGSSSKVAEYTSASFTFSLISVTSSGRSSISNIQTSISGLYFIISFASVERSIVFPAFGGETISPLCPFPIGETRSIILDEISPPPKFNFSSG